MKEIVRNLVLAAFLCILPIKIYCQKILDPEFMPPDVRWDNLLIKGGEASQESKCLLIDSKGFLWSATETALYRFDGVRFVEYGANRGNNEGFTGFTVTTIFEDSEGTIWIGTSEALNKLDQKTGTFLHYIPDPLLKTGRSNFIRAIREDRDGKLWILTKKDIYSFDRKTEEFTQFATDSLSWFPPGSMLIPEDQCYVEDSKGNKWFVTYRGLYLYNSHNKSFRMVLPDTSYSEMQGINKIKCVSADNNGTVWIGTDEAGLIMWNDVLNRPEKIYIQPTGKNKDSFKSISSILIDKDGSVWSFGNGSFSNFNPENKTVRSYIFVYKNQTVYERPGTELWANQSFQSGDGKIWFLIKHAGLMFRFNPVTEKLSLYQVPNFIAYQCIMDQTGLFWFACVRNNIWRLVTEQIPFLTIKVTNSSHVASVHRGAFLEDDQNQIYFLFLYGIYSCKNFDVSNSLVLNEFRFPDGDSIAGGGFKDSKGNLWFGNKNGDIIRYNPLSRELTNLKHRSPPGYTEVVFVPLIREDKAGNIWVATSKGLYLANIKNEKLDHILDFNNKSGAGNVKFLLDFLIDGQGTFWISTYESIMSIRMPEMKITDHTGYGDGIFTSMGSNIRIKEDSKGNIFILNARYGIYQFNRQNESFIKVNVVQENPGMEYYDLLVDTLDRLWVANNLGISVYYPQEERTRLIKTPKLQFDVQSFQTKSGYILFLNDNQLYIFYEDLPFNDYIPPVYLTRLLVNGIDYNRIFKPDNEIAALKKIDLSFMQNTLNFEFASLNYINPERNQYRYYMEGVDRDTAFVRQGLTAEYKNMPPGRYKFWVTGSNNDGLWNPLGVELDIRIHPPLYRSAVAFIIYLLALFSLITGYIRLRTFRLRRDKMRLQSEIDAATSELEKKNRQLEEADRLKTHFFVNISHEIRTPLSLILGPLENISKEEMLSGRMSGMIEMMRRNAQRLLHLVNQLLDISRLDAGKMKINLIEDDIVKSLRILVYEFLSLSESKNIRYIADLPERVFKTWFDRDKVEKIVSNLLTNAFKYTPKNGIVQCSIKIESDESKNSQPFLHISVRDTGHGMSKEHLSLIFNRFFRVERHHEVDSQGAGIGLSLVNEFVSLLHGEIKVNSIPGAGSEFSVTLPLGKEHLFEDEFIINEFHEGIPDKKYTGSFKKIIDPASIKNSEISKIKILVIEDNEDLRNYINNSLYESYNILEAENGKTGIIIAFTMMPDLIVTDIMMPDLDGIQLCTQLKNDQRTSHIPIIMLTAKGTTEDRIAGLESGADDYIVKPFNMAELSTRISNLLALRDNLRKKYDKFHILTTGIDNPESVDDRFMARVYKIINENLRDHSFDVRFLQEHLGMSRTHLTRKLKILTGLSPGTLIRNLRLEKAAVLLKGKTGNITEIANSVGISNPANFTRSFRNYFGISPKNYSK